MAQLDQRELFIINNTQIDSVVPERERPQQKNIRWPLTQERKYDFVEDGSPQFMGGPQRRQGLQLALWMWFASFADTLIIMSLSCFVNLVAVFLIRTFFKAELGFLYSIPNQFLTLFCVFIFTGWIYFITLRALFGASIGERSCSLRLGQPSERLNHSYVAKLVFRTTITLLTGIVVFPLLSLVFKKDLSGVCSGLYVYSLK